MVAPVIQIYKVILIMVKIMAVSFPTNRSNKILTSVGWATGMTKTMVLPWTITLRNWNESIPSVLESRIPKCMQEIKRNTVSEVNGKKIQIKITMIPAMI